MDSNRIIYASFLFDWSVKATSYQFRYRQAFDINEIDEIFCSIINAKGNCIEFPDLGNLLGFNLQDLAEKDVFNIYLKGLSDYNLIAREKGNIQLTKFGQEALQTKLKYKYHFASTELFENQTAVGENFDFSFRNVFDLENRLSREKEIYKDILDNPELKQKLQFQLFDDDIYKGQIIDIYEGTTNISYKNFLLQCETFELDDLFQISVYKSGISKPDIRNLVNLPGNIGLKTDLLRRGMYHHILSEKNSITVQDITTYLDLWDWKELAENPKLEWSDRKIFNLFKDNGNGSVWNAISENAPITNILPVLKLYNDYWNWTTLTRRVHDDFIKENIENFNWDFEELSYRNSELLTSLLQNSNLVDYQWDWNYLSKTLPDNFIEEYIDDFNWDFYLITEVKSSILRNLLSKGNKNNAEYTNILLSKPWNWKFISEKFEIKFLFNQISALAEKVDWETILNRFLNSEEICTRCLKDDSFKLIFKKHLPENFIVAHQNYLWSSDLIAFFEKQNLIQWESKSYINGFDTNKNVEWDLVIFQNYHHRITTESGYLNISRKIGDHTLLMQFPTFSWNWEGISQNKKLINNEKFIEEAFVGKLWFSKNLNWSQIFSNSTFEISFWNKHLQAFLTTTQHENQNEFWKSLTKKETTEYIFANLHYPWDWSFITDNSSEEIILDSFSDEELLGKWDWRIATKKIDTAIIVNDLEGFAPYVDWQFLINEVFTIENELSNTQLPRVAACLTILNIDERREIWKVLTAKFPFEIILPLLQATSKFDIFEWDWDFISNHELFATDIRSLEYFSEKINWSIFAESKAIQKKFNRDSWNDGKEWFKNIDRYLHHFKDNWDWIVLSQNKNINYSRNLLQNYKNENWDWDYLTEYGGFLKQLKKDGENYLEHVVKKFPKIKFEVLSKRQDLKFDSTFILTTKDKNWDWQVLSENKSVDISAELLTELKDKNWNWQALSKGENIAFSNDLLINLSDKNWDWHYLSENKNLEFNAEFLEKTKSKSWNWKSVSRHQSFRPSIQLLTLTKKFDLDWEHISQHSSLNPTKELLAKFEDYWNWEFITKNTQISFSDMELVERFVEKWDWRFICESGDLSLTKYSLSKFKNYLEWNLISSNTNIEFTKEIVQEFKQYWNWSKLKVNKRVEELLGSYVKEQITGNAILNFLDKIDQQWSEWKGNIYHFSHIDNAVEIIKNRKIRSRNKANIKGDAAGNVVHLRNDAHDYARFYFRPHTPTQFYNEYLGKSVNDGYTINGNWVSWYEKARGLGFPKCPIPIFFKFSLKEVLFTFEKECCVSNGNMQTSSTKHDTIEKMIDKFGFDDLYYTPPEDYATKDDYNKYRKYAQQEFLIKNELCFEDLYNFEIICPSQADRKLLMNLLGNEQKDIFSKIVVDKSYYANKNPRVRIDEEGAELHIKSEFNGKGYFILNGTSSNEELEILTGDVIKIDQNKIVFNSYVSVGNVNRGLYLNFIDESSRKWFLYAR